MTDIIYKLVEQQSRKRAQAIEDAFKLVLPNWQWKVLMKTKSNFLAKIFGWELRTYIEDEHFEIWKNGKKHFSSLK